MTPVSRRARERAILEIIEDWPIRTQDDLVRALEGRGFEVTQATISRDLRRLGLVKLRDVEGRSRYAAPGPDQAAPVSRRVLQTALREFATDIMTGDALVVIRTQSGCANAVAVAIDEADLDGVVATLAGDDTIFVLLASREDRPSVLDELEELSGAAVLA